MSRPSGLKVLAYAMTGEEGGENCSKFVEILGLRSLFPLFMKVMFVFFNLICIFSFVGVKFCLFVDCTKCC